MDEINAFRSLGALFRSAIGLATALATVGAIAAPASAEESLRYGSSGPRVARLQRELKATSYRTGRVDGQFGYKTLHSVYAFEKVHGLPRDGTVTDWELNKIANSPRPKAPSGRANTFIDVDISRQVMFEVRDGRVSTGSERYYTVDGKTSKAHTPRGSFTIKRKIRGWRVAPLGRLYYPSYFHEGFAFHGSESVPTYPASHGCVRVPMYVAKRLFHRSPIGKHVYIHR